MDQIGTTKNVHTRNFYRPDIRARYNADQQNQKGSSPTNSYDNVLAGGELGMLADLDEVPGMDRDNEMKRRHVFNDRPFCTYKVN